MFLRICALAAIGLLVIGLPALVIEGVIRDRRADKKEGK